MKSELQTIKKGSKPMSQYLQRIKDAQDHLSAARVYFEDDIMILALNGLPYDYKTFRCMVRGKDNVLSLKDFFYLSCLLKKPLLSKLILHPFLFMQ